MWLIADHWNKYVDNVGFYGTLTDKIVFFFKTNKTCGVLSEDMVKVYTLGGGSPYNTPMDGSKIYYM